MIQVSVRTEFENADNRSAKIWVHSRCFYKVVIFGSKIQIEGPGIEKVFERRHFAGGKGLSFEGEALMAVIELEEKK